MNSVLRSISRILRKPALQRKFIIDFRPKLVKLPDIKEKKKIDIIYPLLPPFAYARIFWDNKTKQLIYYLKEPKLSITEQKSKKLIKQALVELINISYVKATESKVLIPYLEKNINFIIKELRLKISDESYQKIMYYLYRDFVGMNEIEPLMSDYFIEDIECNGAGHPLFIVHRKYRSIRTNIIYKNPDYLRKFVEKLAQKCNKYISFAEPILDGALPDGSRINATYTKDITTRGPTFTIRKFTKEPWSPIDLINLGTASAEIFAFIWMAVQYRFNAIVIGETGSGKTTFLNSLLAFIPSEVRVVSIEDTREINLVHSNWLPAVTRPGIGTPDREGRKYGEVNLFYLLKETFRQNPEYVVVGETRGPETYVLFQGMASGHPSFSTFHAKDIQSLIRRLETPPINLSASLVGTLDLIISLTHQKDEKINKRRLREIDEIIEVREGVGNLRYNKLFTWNPVSDSYKQEQASFVLQQINKFTGIDMDVLVKEWKQRVLLLKMMQKKNITHFENFTKIVSLYYKDPNFVLKNFGIK